MARARDHLLVCSCLAGVAYTTALGAVPDVAVEVDDELLDHVRHHVQVALSRQPRLGFSQQA